MPISKVLSLKRRGITPVDITIDQEDNVDVVRIAFASWDTNNGVRIDNRIFRFKLEALEAHIRDIRILKAEAEQLYQDATGNDASIIV